MRKRHIIAKTFYQITLYIIEVFACSLFITYLTSYLDPITSGIIFVERMVLSYTVYQILVIVVLTNLNDIQKDSYLAWITTLKLTLLYIETQDKNIRLNIDKSIENQLSQSVFNSIDIRDKYNSLKDNIDSIEENKIKFELIIAEQLYEIQSLNWKFSFILRSPLIK